MKRFVISAASVFFSVFLLSVSTPAQTRFGGGVGGGSHGSSSGIQRSPLAVFHVTVVSGTSEYLPSSFMTYDQAVAVGKAQSERDAYMPFAQAVTKGITKEAVRGRIPAVASAANHADSVQKSRVVFVQDNSGRIVRSASSSGGESR